MAKEVKINYGTTDLMLYKYDRQNNLQYDLLYMYIYLKIYTLYYYKFPGKYYRIT